MICTCENETDVQVTIGDVVYCMSTESIPPIAVAVKKPISFDNTDYFKDVSWTISYKPTEGQWDSYFTFHPNFSIAFLNVVGLEYKNPVPNSLF